jgi:hypothetical protein
MKRSVTMDKAKKIEPPNERKGPKQRDPSPLFIIIWLYSCISSWKLEVVGRRVSVIVCVTKELNSYDNPKSDTLR